MAQKVRLPVAAALDNSPRNLKRAVGAFVRKAAGVPGVVRVSVYGSYARGLVLPDSDVDVMVVVAGGHRDAAGKRDLFFSWVFDILLDYRVDLSLRLFDEGRFKELRGSAFPFWKNFSRDEVVLWPKTAKRLRKAA